MQVLDKVKKNGNVCFKLAVLQEKHARFWLSTYLVSTFQLMLRKAV